MRLVAVAACCIALTPSVASAKDAQPVAKHVAKPTWYGTQTLIADAVSAPLVFVGVGVVTYALGPPIIHWAHGNAGTGFGSLALRVVMPLAGAGVGCAVGGCEGRGEYTGAAAGAIVGGLGIVALDAFVFAYEQPEAAPSARMRVTPTVSLGRGAASFALSASF